MNIIELVLDCASYNRIECMPDHISPMPFLMGMKEKGIWCTKYYSQGPYTEAALMGLTFGRDTLDDNGYFASFFDWDKSIYRQFKMGGFDVFVTYSYSVMPKEIKTQCNYTDSSNYCAPFFSRFIRGRLEYYYAIYQKGELLLDDKIIIADFLKETFDVMVNYYVEDSLENDYTKCAFKKRDEEQIQRIENWRRKVEHEKEEFLRSPLEYIEKLFDIYENHFIICECDLFPSALLERVQENRKWLRERGCFWRKLYWLKMKGYLFSNRPERGQFFYYFKLLFDKERTAIGKEYFKRYIKSTFFYNKRKMCDNEVKQLLPCARNDIDALFEWLHNRETDKPFYAYIHVDDYHGESVLCSYDTDDRKTLEKEINDAMEFVEKNKGKYKGDIVKDLSLKYLDRCIEYLFQKLEQLENKEDTIVVITADHGSSNAGGPFRFTNTNNFYDEQYHPILYIYGLDRGRVIDHYINGKDIAKTLLEAADVQFTPNFNGINFLRDKERSHTSVEYMGAGMPDLIRKPIYFGYRDKKVSYVLSIKLYEGLKSLKLIEFYDLVNDPNEYHNLSEKYFEESRKLFECFEKRYNELRENYDRYLEELRKRYLV